MSGVLPEVEYEVALERAVGNTVGRVQHLQDRVVVLLVLRVDLEDRERLRVLRLDPLERLRAVNVLKPQVRVGGAAGARLFVLHAGCSTGCGGAAKGENDGDERD